MKTLGLIIAVALLIGLGLWLTGTNQPTEEATYSNDVYTFTTPDGDLKIQYSDDSGYALVYFSDKKYELERVRSASGSKYANGDQSVVFWEHQGEATLEIDGTEVFSGDLRNDQNISGSDSNLLNFKVGPEKVDCTGVAPMKCLVVNGDMFYDSIIGFDFEPGYNYELLVEKTERENLPTDVSSDLYTLVKVVSKTVPSVDNSLMNTSWQWQETKYNDNSNVEPEKASDFVLNFADESNFSASTDCNNLMGNYQTDRSTLTFEQIAATRKACLNDAQEADFTNMLESAYSYLITQGGNLNISIKQDNGEMIFTPISE